MTNSPAFPGIPQPIYLCQGGQGRGGAWVWIGVEDAAKLHEECKASGLKIKMAPTSYPWALEFHVQDPDGNVLRFGLRAPCRTTDALVEKPAVTDRMYSTLTI